MNKKNQISKNHSKLKQVFRNTQKNLIEIGQKTSFLIQQHRNATRTKLLINPINIATFISILPFILGFYDFLNQKYPAQRKYLFFEKNLPSIGIPNEKMRWDTFQYIVKDQNQVIKTPTQFSWSDKDFLIETRVTTSLIPSSEKNLITYLKSADAQKQATVSNLYKFTLNSEKAKSFSTSYFENLDEIPAKLQAIYLDKPNNKILPLSESLPLSLTKKLNKTYNLQDYTKKNNFLLVTKAKHPTLFKSQQVNVNKLTYNQIFLGFEKSFNNEIRKLFNNTKLIPSLETGLDFSKLEEKIISSKLFKQQDFHSLQDLIREIDNIYLPKPIYNTRLMSGYRYPDMTLNQITGLFCQESLFSTKNIQVFLPSSFLTPQNSNIQNAESPIFLIQAKKLVLQDHTDPTNNIYEGPSILLNAKTGLDWQIVLKDSYPKLDPRRWVENYLNTQNPLSDSFKNFFGIFESPENKISIDLKKLEPNNDSTYWLDHLSIFRSGIITNTTQSYFPFERSFQLPFIEKQDWLNQINNNSDPIKLNAVSLPIIETRIPKQTNPELLFGYNNAIDFAFTNPLTDLQSVIEIGGQSKSSQKPGFLSKFKSKRARDCFQLGFVPATTNYLDQESFQTHLSSGVYQKIPSIFGIKTIFYDLWEPLTFNSWLVTSQIGFAFLVFTVLKALADNYGRELLVYLLDLVALLGFLDDDLKQEIEILMGQREKGFRIISKTTKNFSNVGGIESLLPEIIEIVWFLRNAGREFSISKTLPRGVLLSGPPGTGKTLLVQAIAGEAEVPVLALSGSSLLEPGESGALKLEILFQEARRIAPCIVFIDEMDTLAQKREQVLQNPMGADEILESLSNISSLNSTNNESLNSVTDDGAEKLFAQQDTHKEKLRILMQFLVELDGIQGRDGVVVMGATNRPEMLDAAILRPGRFDRVLELGLPGPEKRKEIFKLYSDNLGIDNSISWNYLLHRTAGYSAADLASIMNQSTLHAILQQTHHTIETIEYGIDRITTIGFEKPFKSSTNNIFTTQLSYYQAGKILLSAILEHHPPTLVTHLWPRRTNVRALQISQNLQKYFFRFARRIELEHRVIGCYAGKAAEILFLQDLSLTTNISDLGTEDIQFAQNLLQSMIQYWYFYGKNISIEKQCNTLSVYNVKEYRDITDKIPFFNSFLTNLELSLSEQFDEFINNVNYSTGGHDINKKPENSIEQQAQKYFPTASWQHRVSDEFEIAARTFSDWYRLYLPDPQQTERNLEWTPPDEFYHGNILIEELTESLNWNDLTQVHIDYQIHSLILQSFNKAFVLLDQHREVLDHLATELVHREILREPEIEKILKQFQILADLDIKQPAIRKLKSDQIITQSWGKNSRRTKGRWINVNSLKNSSTC